MRHTLYIFLRVHAKRHSNIFLLLGSIVLCAPSIYAAAKPTLLSSYTTTTAVTVDQAAALNPFAQNMTAVLSAEFALAQYDPERALNTYVLLVRLNNQPAINERALNLALELGDLRRALEISKLWVLQDPEDIPARFYLVHIALKAGQYDTAAQTLDYILSVDPNADLEQLLQGLFPESNPDRQAIFNAMNKIQRRNNPFILVLLAGLDAQAGEFDKALKQVNKALRRRKQVASFILLKANLLLNAKQEKKALKWLRKESMKQSSPDVGLFAVDYLIQHNQLDEALAYIQQLLKRWPNNERLLFLAGTTSIDTQRFATAEMYLQQLQQSVTYQDQANYFLAINAQRHHEEQRAEQLYLSVEGNFYMMARKNLVALLLKQNRASDAIRLLTKERVSHPNQASFLYQLQAQLLQQQGHTQDAIQLLNEAQQQMPDDAELIYAQVLLYDPFKDQAKLDVALDQLLSIEPNNPTFLNAYAYILAQQNRNLDTARQYAEQALSAAPQQASILDTLGYIAYLQNDYATAVNVLSKAYATSSALNIGIRYAQALYMSGDLNAFNQVLGSLNQKYPNAHELKQLQHLIVPTLQKAS